MLRDVTKGELSFRYRTQMNLTLNTLRVPSCTAGHASNANVIGDYQGPASATNGGSGGQFTWTQSGSSNKIYERGFYFVTSVGSSGGCNLDPTTPGRAWWVLLGAGLLLRGRRSGRALAAC